MAPIPPWPDLPQELLSAIANFLTSNPIDILRFRSVCKSWHSSSLSLPHSFLSPLFPLTTPSPFGPSTFCSKFYLLSATSVFALRPPNGVAVSIEGSSKTWLLFLDQLNPNGKVSIRKPLSKWNFEMPLDFPRRLNLLAFHVSEIGQFYNVASVERQGDRVTKYIWSGDIYKVLLFSNGSVVVVLFGDGKLGLMRLGLGVVGDDVMGDEWKIIHDGKGFRFDDIVDYRGRLLGIDRRGRVYEVGYELYEMKLIVAPITGGGGRRKRLINSLGILYLVIRFNDRGTKEEMGKFKVYVLNEEIGKWVEVTSVGDRIFFFGLEFSFSTSPQEFEGSFGKNCIVYNECSFGRYDACISGDSSSFYTSRPDALRVGVYHLEEGARLHSIEAYPDYANILWPPPPWLWLNDKLKLLGIFETAVERLLARTRDESLKAKFKELYDALSPPVRAVVYDGNSNRLDMINFLKQADMAIKFLNELVAEMDKESKSIKMNIIKEAMSRRPHSESEHPPIQEGISSVRAEDKNGLVGNLENATQDLTSRVAWLKNEWVRRLGVHFDLRMLLSYLTRVIEGNIYKIHDNVNSTEHASVSADEETRLSQSTQTGV